MGLVSFIDLFGLIWGRRHETEITAYECEPRYDECATATRAIRSFSETKEFDEILFEASVCR